MTPLPPAVPRPLTALAALDAGGVVTRVLHRTAGGSVTLLAIGAGQGLREHTTPLDALVVVVGGEARVTVAGESHALVAGEAIRLPATVPHAVAAVSDLRMLLVVLKGTT